MCAPDRFRALRRAAGGALVAAGLALPSVGWAQPASAPAAARPAPAVGTPLDAGPGLGFNSRLNDLKGRVIEGVEVRGNQQVPTNVIKNLLRTRQGETFDPLTVAEDYQRVYGLRKFSNVEAKVEPTATGVLVVYIVTEQKQINSIRFTGNAHVDSAELRSVVDVKVGEAIDTFRIALSKNAIENLYRDKNYPLAHVETAEAPLAQHGELVFNIVEGPNTRIRKIDFKSADPLSFSKDKLSDQVKTAPYLFIFRAGKYDPQQVEEDVASLRRYYESKGFFDARVGRKLIWSPDLSEMEIDFVIDEGVRYKVDKVTFHGNAGATDAQLRAHMKLLEGKPFDAETQQRDTREIVREYSTRFGYIYLPQSTDPDYLRVDAKPKFLATPGHIELIYDIHEGKEFRLGNIYVKGNFKSQDKLVLREFRDFTPGKRFNSADFQDTQKRLQQLPYFSSATLTPIGDAPGVRDILVEVTDQRTASFNVGAGVNSNGGVGGNITYEQRNFDITNLPANVSDIFSDRAFTGGGQDFRASFEPGEYQTNASIRITEPFLLDQLYSLSNDLYLRDRYRVQYDERREGDQLTLGKRFDYVWSAGVSLRGEVVKVSNLSHPEKVRAPEILDGRGSHTVTSAAFNLRRDTTNPGVFPDSGSVSTFRWEAVGALGGEYSFQKVSAGIDRYITVYEDLLDRKTVLGLHANVGAVPFGNSVFFERFYGGGIGSLRGFEFRGVSPRSGRAEDAIGGDFVVTTTAELNFPVVGESLRGVVFTDIGDVEPDVRIGTIRSSVGAGVRLILPFLGQTPLAIDFALPITKSRQDDTQLISFSFGFIQ